MSDKKRTTVTTIETHEVWIIRRSVPEISGEAEVIVPREIAQPTQGQALGEHNNTSPANEEEEP